MNRNYAGTLKQFLILGIQVSKIGGVQVCVIESVFVKLNRIRFFIKPFPAFLGYMPGKGGVGWPAKYNRSTRRGGIEDDSLLFQPIPVLFFHLGIQFFYEIGIDRFLYGWQLNTKQDNSTQHDDQAETNGDAAGNLRAVGCPNPNQRWCPKPAFTNQGIQAWWYCALRMNRKTAQKTKPG